ncbi:hypothetical protein HYC85_031522 [Camellia sinensis]|uniref:Uncharacterized protein n=1 Tax=Camellia sinensis TaxID=4442 RepID=A0A7J7FR07_CAMSI|nr:hypothetical protein HYC85_031522 [Camellia sinensis]
MVLFLLNLIFTALSTLSNLITKLIFNATAYLIVLMIQAFKVPGEAFQNGLEQVAELIKSLIEYLVGLAADAISNLILSLFNLVVEGVSGSAAATGLVLGGLVEQTRNSLDGLFKDLPDVLGGFKEMISTIISDLWNNYKEAAGYVTENA